MKLRVGLIMLGAGLLLLGLFFILYNPNAVLQEAAKTPSATDTSPAETQTVDPAQVALFLASFNERYAELRFRWQTRLYQFRSDSSRTDRYQVEAAHRTLLEFAGLPENLAAVREYYPLLTLPDLQDRQLAVIRRLAALRPGDLPAPLLDVLHEPVSDPRKLPELFRVRNQAARSLGYGSYLELMADDLDLDRAAWIRLLKSLLEVGSPLQERIRAALSAVPVGGTDPTQTTDRPARALAFWRELDLPTLPPSPQPAPETLDDVSREQARLACKDAGLPPLLRGPSCRAFARAMVHLADLGARSVPRENLTAEQLAYRLLQESADGPVMEIPLYAGAYLDWLVQLDRGLLAPPMVLEKFRRYVVEQSLADAPGREDVPAATTLPEAAFGRDAEPVAPLDDILGWAIAHQLHRYICTRLLQTDVHRADYRHDPRVGDFLLGILRQGKGKDWQVILRQATGEDFDPGAMSQYYQPLIDDLASR